MSLKLELLKGLVFMVIGAYLAANYSPKPPAVVLPVQKAICKAVIKKTIKPDGTVDEVTEFLAESSQKQSAVKPEPGDNLFFIADQKSVESLIRLDHLLLGLGYDTKSKEMLYKLGYSIRIF